MQVWYRSPLPWLMFLCCAVLGWAMVKAWPRQPQAVSPAEQATSYKLPSEVEVFAADPSLGARDAKVTIVEFSDFECPYCAQSAPVLRQAVERTGSTLRLVWKDYPGPGHDQALPAAIAAQCANQQGKFWQFHDGLFREQSSLSRDKYLQLAGETGLRLQQFTSCIDEKTTQAIVERNVQEGDAVGIDGTPYFIINGQVWSGLLTASDLEAIIRQYP
jgi:protein-disulfide isomerase